MKIITQMLMPDEVFYRFLLKISKMKPQPQMQMPDDVFHRCRKSYRLLTAAINRISATEDKRSETYYDLQQVTDIMQALNACYASITSLMSVYSEMQFHLISQSLTEEDSL